MPSPQNTRRLVLTGAVTVITIAGSLYGAGIKTEQEVTQTTRKTREATIDERIDALRSTRQNLSGKKEMVEKQMRDLEAKIEERKRKGLGDSKGDGPQSS